MASISAREAPRRVMVVGCAGAGKTTFAHRLARQLGLPVICLDLHFWRAGWQIPDDKVWREQTVALASRPEWVMDGNYSNTYDIRMVEDFLAADRAA